MISVGSPVILGTAVAGALATVALHFLSVRRPPVLVLPTMRFLPDRPVRAVSRSARPSDLWLLLVRVLVLLLAGIALAGVSYNGGLFTHGRVIVVSRAADAGDVQQLRTRVRDLLRARGDTATRLVMVDSLAQILSVAQMRAFQAETLSSFQGVTSLSTMLLSGVRAASELVREERNVDSVELVLVAQFDRRSEEPALASARAAWPGSVRMVEIVRVVDSLDGPIRRNYSSVGDAPSAAVMSFLNGSGLLSNRVRGAQDPRGIPAQRSATSATSLRLDPASPIHIEWPASGIPAGWSAAAKPDTIGGLIARGRALVWPFVRTSRAPKSMLHARAIAWWSDGEVAAIEKSDANACVKQVGVLVAGASDVLQGAGTSPLLAALGAPCGGDVDPRPLSDATRSLILGPAHAAPSEAFRSPESAETPFASIMLLAALLLLALEWWIRDREGARLASMRSTTPRLDNAA